jgi:hypothetical protein
MSITLDGTNGITTPDVDTDGLTVDTNTLFVDTANNRVGIGTTAPSVAAGKGIEINGGASHARIAFKNDATGSAAGDGLQVGIDGAGLAFVEVAQNQPLRFSTNNVETARIDASGEFLVGCTGLTGDAPNVAGGTVKQTNGNTKVRVNTDGNPAFQFYSPTGGTGGPVGSITVGATNTAYNTSSDYRLKEDVQPMVGASDRLMALKPVNFAWKINGERVDGFLAHEAQEVVPECVTGEKDQVQIVEIKDEDGNVTGAEERPVYQGIDQSKIVPLLVAALQEALTKIEALEARVAALETNA